MRILFIIGELNSGGAERQFLLNALALSEKHEVFISLINNKNDYESFCKDKNLKIIKLNKPRGKIWNIYIIFALSKLIIKNKIDILHSFLGVPNFLSMICSFLTRRDLVTSFRSSIDPKSVLWRRKTKLKLINYNRNYTFLQKLIFLNSLTFHGFIWFFLVRLICYRSIFIYFNSSNSLESHKKFFYLENKKLFVIHNIVSDEFLNKLSSKKIFNLKKKYNLLENKITFLCISRLVKEKNILFLINAFIKLTSLSQNFIENKLIICGSGNSDYIKKINSLIHNHKNIELLDKMESIVDLYQISDAFIFPSKWYEANPNVLLESMATGLYIIASNKSDPLKLIDNTNGSKFDPDDENDLINKINFYLQSSNFDLELIKKRNKNFINKNYSFSLIKKQLNDLYGQYF